MSETATKLLEQVLALPQEDRAMIAERLNDSLSEQTDEERDPAFEAELNRRLESVADGTANIIPWEQARTEMQAELERRRTARGGAKS
jgi:putative addiction module component (TIGR02574 family)